MGRVFAGLCVVIGCIAAGNAQERIVVSAQTTVLRGTPDAAGEKIATMKFLDSAELIITRGDWHLVQTTKYVGWVDTRAVTKERGPDGPGMGGGMGMGQGSGVGTGKVSRADPGPAQDKSPEITTPLKILSKPLPRRTEAARANNITGTVILRVTFLASGKVGTIRVVKGLPHGLTEQAVSAAQQIRFDPARAQDVPQTVTKVLEYTFSVY